MSATAATIEAEPQSKPASVPSVRKNKPQQVQIQDAPVSESTALIQMIERAARDPACDIDKMERLMKMHASMLDRTAKAAYDAALAEMQPELPTITQKGRIEVRAKDSAGERTGKILQSTGYAKWEDINEGIRPTLAKHGFALSFRTGMAADGKITITGILSHKDGHREETTMTLPHDSTGSKNAVQAVGSSTSYGKRYTASALLNITTRGEDDDAKAAGAEGVVSDEQADKIRALITETKADVDRFLKWAGAESISDLPAAKFNAAVAMLNAKKTQTT